MRPSADLLKSVWRHSVGLFGLKSEDVWLASFPRSGNTWVRTVILHTTFLKTGQDPSFNMKSLAEFMPVYGYSNLFRKWPYPEIPRTIKTHRRFNLLMNRPRTTIYVLRDPRDCMVSYYHYLSKHRWIDLKGDFPSFLRHRRFGLEACIGHYLSWKPRITYLLRYEDLRARAVDEFGRMFETLGWGIERPLVAEAVERSGFDRIQAMEISGGIRRSERFSADFVATRSGRSDQWIEYFSTEDLEYFNKLCVKHSFNCYS